MSTLATSTATAVATVNTDGKKATIVTERQLRDILIARSGSAFISVLARYDMSAGKNPKMRKTDNPFFGNCFKVAETRGGVTFDYDAGVARRLVGEGKDTDEHRKGTSWHLPVLVNGKLSPLAVHKADVTAPDGTVDYGMLNDATRVYLRYRFDASISSRFEKSDGTPLPSDAVKPFVKESSDYGNQGLEDPLRFQLVAFSNIVSLTIDGTVYFIHR